MSVKESVQAVKSIVARFIAGRRQSAQANKRRREREKAIKAEDWIRLDYLIRIEQNYLPPEGEQAEIP